MLLLKRRAYRFFEYSGMMNNSRECPEVLPNNEISVRVQELIDIRVPVPTALAGHSWAFAGNLPPNLMSP